MVKLPRKRGAAMWLDKAVLFTKNVESLLIDM